MPAGETFESDCMFPVFGSAGFHAGETRASLEPGRQAPLPCAGEETPAAALQAFGAGDYSLLPVLARIYPFGSSGPLRLGPSSRISPMIEQIRAQISSTTPITVNVNPPRAAGPVVVVQRTSDDPETGRAALKLTVPWQYSKINPSPVARNRTAAIKRRSGFIRFTSLLFGLFTIPIVFEARFYPLNVCVDNPVRLWSNPLVTRVTPQFSPFLNNREEWL